MSEFLSDREAEIFYAEQRGYASAMEAERKLHEARIEELEAKLAATLEALEIVSNYRKKCHDYDDDIGHDLRTFAEEDIERIEGIAHTTLEELTGGKDE